MKLLIEDIKSYFLIDKEDKALQVEKLIELLYTPLATYINEDIVDFILDEDAQSDDNFIEDIVDNYLDYIENALESVLSSLESSFEHLLYNKTNELTDSYYELIDASIDIDKITIE